jgi:hypothetical protein
MPTPRCRRSFLFRAERIASRARLRRSLDTLVSGKRLHMGTLAWQGSPVTFSMILRRVLSIYVIVALIAGPFVVPAFAGTGTADQMASVADDMPCCPPVPSSSDDHKCPFMAICMSQCLLGLPAGIQIDARIARVSRTAFPLSDTFADGLGRSPPPRPPRSLIVSA